MTASTVLSYRNLKVFFDHRYPARPPPPRSPLTFKMRAFLRTYKNCRFLAEWASSRTVVVDIFSRTIWGGKIPSQNKFHKHQPQKYYSLDRPTPLRDKETLRCHSSIEHLTQFQSSGVSYSLYPPFTTIMCAFLTLFTDGKKTKEERGNSEVGG